MKYSKLISVIFLVLMMLSVFAGCNNKAENADDPQQTLSTSLEADTTASSSAATEATQHSVQNTEPEATSAVYTTESDELEILTPDAGNASGYNDPESIVTDPAVPENTTPQNVESLPQMEDIIDEPIELPFVPIS